MSCVVPPRRPHTALRNLAGKLERRGNLSLNTSYTLDTQNLVLVVKKEKKAIRDKKEKEGFKVSGIYKCTSAAA